MLQSQTWANKSEQDYTTKREKLLSDPYSYNEGIFINSIIQLLESRNVLITVCQTTEYLQENGICSTGISLFVTKDVRTAELKLIPLRDIVRWVDQINRIIQRLLWDYDSDRIFEREELPAWKRAKLQDLMRDPLVAIEFPPLALDGTEGYEYESLSLVAELWWLIARALDLAAVSYCGSHIEMGEENYNAMHLHYTSKVSESGDGSPEWIFFPVQLDCLDGLLQKKRIWVLEARTGSRIMSPARVSASIEDLADIWGPVWKLVETAAIDPGSVSQCYYGVGPGAIVRWPSDHSDPGGAINCHYLSSVAELGPEHLKIDVSQNAKLLIGAPFYDLRATNSSCVSSQAENLCGLRLRPLGTSERSRYRDATTYNLAGGYSGIQLGGARTYKFRDALTRKQRILSKWRLEPEKRNPDVLSLWCGLEVSLCTRNASRRRLIHLLGSESLSRYSKHALFKWNDSNCQRAFQKALEDEDAKAFTDLYVQHEEWRPDLGRAISLLFDALGSTGVVPDGNLETFVFVEDSNDPEQVAVFPRDKHTWVSLLKDTVKSATFAMASNTCFSFPYGNANGQRCRCINVAATSQHTILQTAIVPAMSGDLSDTPSWSSTMPEGKCLALDDLKRNMLKLIYRLPNGHLILQWSDSEWARTAMLMLPGWNDIVRFREYVEDSTFEKSTAAAAYIISKSPNVLPPLWGSDVASLSSTTIPKALAWSGKSFTLSVPPLDTLGHANNHRQADTAEKPVTLKECSTTRRSDKTSYEIGLGEDQSNNRRLSGKGKGKQLAHDALPHLQHGGGLAYEDTDAEGFQWHSKLACDSAVDPPQRIQTVRESRTSLSVAR